MKKLISTNHLIYVSLSVLFLCLTVCGLYYDVINPDAVNWHTRSYTFFKSLMSKSYSHTYQAYHPGTTLMWIVGPVLYLTGQYYLNRGAILYSKDTFLSYDFNAKFTLAIVCTILFLTSLIILNKILSKKALVLFGIFIIFEPFIIGQRRLFHLDFLMSYLVFLSFLSFYLFFYKETKFKFIFLGCLFFVLGTLTKTTSLIFFPFIFLMCVFSKLSFVSKIKYSCLILFLCVVCVSFLFPPFWKKPLKNVPKYSSLIISGIKDIGYGGKREYGYSGEKEAVIIDKKVVQFPWYYYIKAFKYQVSPISQILIFISFFTLLYKLFKFNLHKDKNWFILLFSFLIMLSFIFALSISSKKDERYSIVYYPYLFLITSYLTSFLKTKYLQIFVFLLITSLFIQYKEIYPYFYVYGNPVFGGVKEKYKNLKSAPFGVATYQTYKEIRNAYEGKTFPLVVSGSKSLKAISYGARFERSTFCQADYLVAFANETQPTVECLADTLKLIKTVRISNMNYWNIYEHIKSNEERERIRKMYE